MTTATCAWSGCGRTFEAERADARYCSPNCRARASKDRRRAEGEPEQEARDAPTRPARPEPARSDPPRTDASRLEPAKPPLKAGPDSEPPFDVEEGAPANAWERFLRLEERVDDLEYYGKQDFEQRVDPLAALPDRLAKLEARVPSEAKIKEWSKEEALDVIQDLRERLDALEAVVNGPDGLVNLDPAYAGLERRVAALEDPDGGDASLRIQVRRLQRALVHEKERNDLQSENISMLLASVDGLTKLVEG